MRYPVLFTLLLGLALAVSASFAAVAQEFYGTGSTYTGQKVPIQTLNAISAEKRKQSADDAQMRLKQQQLRNDQRRALTTGDKLGCQGKTAATTNCASEPMPQFDRRATTLEQQSDEARRQSEERIRLLEEGR